MEKSFIDPVTNSAALGLSIGLLIADTASERLCMVALLCRNPVTAIFPSLLIKAPMGAVNTLRERDSVRRMRFCEPLVGEVFDFAQKLPGGVAIRRNNIFGDSGSPAVVVTKRVTADQWGPALARSQQWALGCQKVFPQLLERTALHQSKLLAKPGEMSDPELEQFRIFVLSMALEMRSVAALTVPVLDACAEPARTFRPAR